MKLRKQTNKIICHCSDSEIIAHDNVETIRSWHLERGFDDIGYHFVISKQKGIEVGRDIDLIGAHVKGQNKDSIGVCLCGKNNFTDFQFQELGILIDSLEAMYGELELCIHRQFSSYKTCPNNSLYDIKRRIEENRIPKK